MVALNDLIEVNPRKLGGVPVLKSTRFSIGQLLSELADSAAVSEVASDFELDEEQVRQTLHALAVFLNHPDM